MSLFLRIREIYVRLLLRKFTIILILRYNILRYNKRYYHYYHIHYYHIIYEYNMNIIYDMRSKRKNGNVYQWRK